MLLTSCPPVSTTAFAISPSSSRLTDGVGLRRRGERFAVIEHVSVRLDEKAAGRLLGGAPAEGDRRQSDRRQNRKSAFAAHVRPTIAPIWHCGGGRAPIWTGHGIFSCSTFC